MDPNIENNILELIARHLSGESTEGDEQLLKQWMGLSGENRKTFEKFRSVWENMDRVRSAAGLDLDREWSQLESKIRASGSSDTIISPTVNHRERNLLFMVTRIAVAALVLIGLVTGAAYVSRNIGNITVQTADLQEPVELPDGSSVTLNSHSILNYPKRFRKDQREVSLEGEAFFDVSHNPEWPFSIRTRELVIRVLGTSFNVNAYESNSVTEITVETGSVAVTRQGEVPRTVILKPGNKAVYNKTKENLSLSTAIDRNYLAWKTRSVVFEDQSLEMVAVALNRIYGADILIPSDSLKNVRITTSFYDDSLKAILAVLAATLDLEVVELDGKTILKELD